MMTGIGLSRTCTIKKWACHYNTFRQPFVTSPHLPWTSLRYLNTASNVYNCGRITGHGCPFSLLLDSNRHLVLNRIVSKCFSNQANVNAATRLLKNKQWIWKDIWKLSSNKNQVIRWTTNSSKNGNQAKKTVPKTRDIRRLISLAKPEKWRIGAAIGLLCISSTVSMAVPLGIGKVIDIFYTQTDREYTQEKFKNFMKILLSIFVLGACANFGRVYLMRVSGQRIVKSLREKLFGSIINQEVAFFDRTKTGELVNRLSADTSVVGTSVTMNLSDGLRSTAQASVALGMMFYVSPKLTLITVSIVPPVAIVAVIFGRYIRGISKKVQDALAKSTEVAEERLANHRTVRAFVQEPREISLYNEKITRVLDLSYKEALANAVFFGFTGLSGNVMIMSLLYYGGSMVGDAQISVGDLTSFLFYAVYIGVSVTGLSSFYSELMRGLGASSRLWDLTDRVPRIPLDSGIHPTEALQGKISFQDVHFTYPSRPDSPIFKGLNLEIPQGSILAVVGPSGSGKSTLASLLLRYYDPDNGKIFVDGHSTQELSPMWLRHNMGVVSQEPILFSSSIRDNIAYGAPDPSIITDDEIIEAAKKANAYNFVRHFGDKFDTLAGERGVMLSGGQKQRIAIARAILKNPKILLLDEATSALDAESEYLVQEALERVMVDRTVITIAHRLSTIKTADNIAVLDDGRVSEFGSYDQLMAIDGGMFRKLVERQTIVNT